MDPEKGHIRIAAVAVALVIVVALVAVIAMPRDVSVEKEGDGTLSFEGEKSLRAFGSLEIGIEPGDGCVAKVYLDGDEVASGVTSYKYSAPFADFSKHEIKVVFERSAPVPEPDDKVTLTVEKSEGGSVDPVGASKVTKGSVQTISITPNDGYVIDGIAVDGKDVTVSNVLDVKMDADHTVSVSFRQADAKDIAVNIDVDAQIEIKTTGGDVDFGKVVPSGNIKVRPGSSLKITLLLNPGFEIEDFKVDGKSVGKVTEYTIENIQKSVDISISVVKQVDGYVIKATAGSGGKITPSGETTVEKGKDATFTFSANSGYTVSEVLVDGKKVTATGSYTFKNVTSDHTISVSFKYTGGGSVTPSKTLTKIEVTQQPTKTTYWKGDTFDKAGMEVTATYSDGSERVLVANEYSVSPSEMKKDTTKVTVSYGGKTCDIPVTVKYVTDLEVKRIGERTWYKVGEIVTSDVLEVTATISDGTTEVVTDYEIAPSTQLKKDDQLSVTYRGYTKSVFIDIYELDHITADTEKKTYLTGVDFDKGSMTVKAFYKNGSGEQNEEVTDFSIDPRKSDEAGSCSVTVTYQEKTCTLTLTIVDPNKVTSITVTAPTKTTYFDDTKLDTTGLVITGTTAVGEVKIPVDMATITEGTADSEGKIVVTVAYNGNEGKFDIYRTLMINSVSDLMHFRDRVNGGETYEGKTITLNADIDLEKKPWTPIGTEDMKFEGTFSGNNKTISNLNATLFGNATGAIKDVTVKDAAIETKIFIGTGVAKISGLKFQGTLTTSNVDALTDACVYGDGNIIIKLGAGTYTPTSMHTIYNEKQDQIGTKSENVITISSRCEVTLTHQDGVAKDKVIFDGQFKVTGKLSAKDIVMQTAYTTSDVSQFSHSGVALMNEGEFHAEGVLFRMTTKGDYTAITAWWSSGKGTVIEVKDSTFDCLGNRPIRSDGNVSVENCTFNDQYRYSVQLTSKATTMTCEEATVVFKGNTINAGSTVTGKPVYGVQLEGTTYGCSNLTISGSGNTINFGETGKVGFMYFCDCGSKIDHSTISWNTEQAPIHKNWDMTITTEEQLRYFAILVNSGSSYAGKTITLGADIDLGDNVWTPIGPSADDPNKFMGTFDGNGKTISNLKIDTKTDEKYQATGFFGALNGTVKNLNFKGAEIDGFSGGNNKGNTDNGIAVVAGSVYSSGSIEDVKVEDAILKGNRYIGTISGYVYGSITGCIVSDITIVATPNKFKDDYDNGDKVGGIAGYWCSENGYSLSNNKVSGLTITAYRDAGGIVGAADAGKVDGNPNPTIKMEGNKVDTVSIVIDQSKSYGDEEPNAKAICGRLLACSGEIPDSNIATGFTRTIGPIQNKTSFAFMAKHAVDGDTLILAGGDYELVSELSGKMLTLKAVDGAEPKFDMTSAIALHNSNLTFEKLKFVYENANNVGIQHTNEVKYTGCTIEGKIFLYGSTEKFEKCYFVNKTGDYNVWTYGGKNVTFSGCTFECAGKAVLVYNEGAVQNAEISLDGCTFESTKAVGKSAVEIDTRYSSFNVSIKDCKLEGEWSKGTVSGEELWNNKAGNALKISIDGNDVTIEKIGFIYGQTDDSKFLEDSKMSAVLSAVLSEKSSIEAIVFGDSSTWDLYGFQQFEDKDIVFEISDNATPTLKNTPGGWTYRFYGEGYTGYGILHSQTQYKQGGYFEVSSADGFINVNKDYDAINEKLQAFMPYEYNLQYLWSYKVKLVADLDFENRTMDTIDFRYASVDGKNGDSVYTVKNANMNAVHVQRDSVNKNFGGFVTSVGSISNISFDNIRITCDSSDALVGVVAGYSAGNAENVHVSNSSISINANGCYAGGLFGDSYAHMKNCSIDTVTISGGKNVGSLAGYVAHEDSASTQEISNNGVSNVTINSTEREKTANAFCGRINADKGAIAINGAKISNITVNGVTYDQKDLVQTADKTPYGQIYAGTITIDGAAAPLSNR